MENFDPSPPSQVVVLRECGELALVHEPPELILDGEVHELPHHETHRLGLLEACSEVALNPLGFRQQLQRLLSTGDGQHFCMYTGRSGWIRLGREAVLLINSLDVCSD